MYDRPESGTADGAVPLLKANSREVLHSGLPLFLPSDRKILKESDINKCE